MEEGKKKKKPHRERTGEKKKECWRLFFTEEGRSAGDFNEGEKEGGGDRDTTCVEEIA